MSSTEGHSPDALEIRRYSNRRFYDPSRSKHVTLEEIREMVRDGQDVRVVEADTGQDITSRTLTQIILEYDDRKIAALPSAMLHRLIRSSESIWSEFMEQYFKGAARMFEESRRVAAEPFPFMAGLPKAAREMAPWWPAAWGGSQPPEEGEERAPEAGAAGSSAPEDDAEKGLRRVVDELRAQLEGMQDELKEMRDGGQEEGSAKKGASK